MSTMEIKPLCQIQSLGLSGPELVSLICTDYPHRFITPNAQEVRRRKDPTFPVTPKGKTLNLCAVFYPEGERRTIVEKHYRDPNTREIWALIERLGLQRPPPDAADYLLKMFGFLELMRLVNLSRPEGFDGEARCLLVPHDPTPSPNSSQDVITVLHTEEFGTEGYGMGLLSNADGRWHAGWPRTHAILAVAP